MLFASIQTPYRIRRVKSGNADFREQDKFVGTPPADTNSCVRREVGVDPRCPAAGGGEGIEDINFTPGNPIGLRGGLTIFF
jgi:hypothetical protein